MNVRPEALQSLLRRTRRRLAARLLAEPLEHLRAMPFRDAGHGHDVFGYEPLHAALRPGRWMERLHRHWFRVHSQGTEHVPAPGRGHARGQPLGHPALRWDDGVDGRHPPVPAPAPSRAPTTSSPLCPTSAPCTRARGVVGGTVGNLRALLEAGELLLIFPEGVPGILKPFRERYRLRDVPRGPCGAGPPPPGPRGARGHRGRGGADAAGGPPALASLRHPLPARAPHAPAPAGALPPPLWRAPAPPRGPAPRGRGQSGGGAPRRRAGTACRPGARGTRACGCARGCSGECAARTGGVPGACWCSARALRWERGCAGACWRTGPCAR